MSIPWMGIFIVCELKGSVVWQPLTTRRHSRSLRRYVKISLCEAGKFYRDINYFICEQNFPFSDEDFLRSHENYFSSA